MTAFFHRFVLTDGSVIVVPHRQAQRVLDVRDNRRVPEVCWEIELDNGLVRRVWASEILTWEQEQIA
jgi:hypothetical protein